MFKHLARFMCITMLAITTASAIPARSYQFTDSLPPNELGADVWHFDINSNQGFKDRIELVGLSGSSNPFYCIIWQDSDDFFSSEDPYMFVNSFVQQLSPGGYHLTVIGQGDYRITFSGDFADIHTINPLTGAANSVQSVPEPATALMLLSGLLLMSRFKVRRKSM